MTFASHLFWLNCIRKLSDFDLVYLVKVEFSRVENCLVHLWCMPCCLLQCIELPKDYWCYCISVLLGFSTRKLSETKVNVIVRFLVTCCVKEKTLVVTKNPQGEGGEKRRFFFWLLWPYREKMQSSHSPKGGRQRKKKAHTLIYAEWSRHTT